MKNCTAMYSGPRQEKAELSCQTLDPPPQASSLPSTTSEGADEDQSSQSPHKAKFINSGKKNETAFLDVIGRDPTWSHLAASCLKCIFDDLPKTHN
uniref:Cathelicidin-OA1 n=1 Tax=Odorrana andersonii TaxID=369514 RepID=A0A2U8ZUL5_ODOAN|nr:cathelicidin-OA1 [Odorrana andersonii]